MLDKKNGLRYLHTEIDALSLFIFNFLPNTTAIVDPHSFPNFSTTEPHIIEYLSTPSQAEFLITNTCL